MYLYMHGLSLGALIDSVGSGSHRVHDVAPGAADTSVAGMMGVVDLDARPADKGVDKEGASSLVMAVSGLMVSG